MKKNIDSEPEMHRFAAEFLDNLPETLRVLAIYGDLGAGKTVLSREIIRFLTKTPDLEVPSPTFTLVQTYEYQSGLIWHFDLYRIEDAEEIFELGWEDALNDRLVLIEWPQRLGALLPKTRTDIYIETVAEKPSERTIEIRHRTA